MNYYLLKNNRKEFKTSVENVSQVNSHLSEIKIMENNLQMLTTDQVGELLNVHRNQIQMYRECGIIQGIKTGKNFMYSQQEIMEFQERFRGYDISNKFKVKESLQQMKMKEVITNG